MSDVTLDPYLFFKGDCREAMEFYQDIFGGELTIQTYGDVGTAPEMAPDGNMDSVMHAMLEGGAVKLLASDTAQASPRTAKVSLALGGTDEAALQEMFDKLGDGGTVGHPMKKEFWGDTYGDLSDKYGVDWMVNIAAPKEA